MSEFDKTNVSQLTLPAITVQDMVPIPNTPVPIVISSDSDLSILDEVEESDEKLLVIKPLLKFADTDFCAVGKLISITPKKKKYVVEIDLLVRANIIVDNNDYCTVKVVPSISQNSDAEMSIFNEIESKLRQFSKYLAVDVKNEFNKIFFGHTPDELADIVIINFSDDEQRVLCLEEPNIYARLVTAKALIQQQLSIQNKLLETIDNSLDAAVQAKILQYNKENFLLEKIKVIQEELGNKAIQETEIIELKQKINSIGLPKQTKEHALAELKRYSTIGNNSGGEASVIRQYLDFMLSLPWDKQAEEQVDFTKAKEQLDKDHFGLDKIKERILEYLAVYLTTGKKPQTILCLVGPPGVGKTSLATSIAKALNKPFVKQALGGVKDESEIRGHRRTYLGAMPGRILNNIKNAGVNNPVFLLDEIDKLSSDYRGDPASALLEVLDPEQNKVYSDNYLEEPFDLSNVFFICTANYIDNIPTALKDRMEIIELSSYTEVEKLSICKKYLIPKQLKSNGLKSSLFGITDDAIYKLIREYTMEAGVRELERLIGSIIRKIIKQQLLANTETLAKVKITPDLVVEYLGKPKFTFNTVDKKDQVGITTGLAYTQAGGDTLSIEATLYKGKGNLQLTGKLGDVMKESAMCAFSWVRANAHALHIDSKLFEENDLHIHVPEGAVPKDGPSAGVTLATTIVSLFTNRPVNHLVGMTGEIDLRGNVTAIGGLKEKSIAAHKSGLKTILIPKENEKDLDDIPDIVKNNLNIIPITRAQDALYYALGMTFPENVDF